MRNEIATDWLLLRRYEPGLAPLLLEAAREAGNSSAFTRFAPWCHPAYRLADSEHFIAQSQRDWETGAAYQFALLDPQTGELCGGIGLNQPNLVHGFYNLGYWVRPSRQRQGLATQATRQLARAAFADLPGLYRLELLVLPANQASQRVARAAGAHREGRLRQRLRLGGAAHDAILFSLVPTDVVA